MAGERLDVHNYGDMNEMVRGHKFRYFLARGFIKPFDRVIDAACGTGYGSNILATAEHVHVTSFDFSESTIKEARKLYTSSNIDFRVQNLDEWQPTLDQCDVAVSFETIEHLKGKPEDFAKKLKTAASRMVIVSAPIIPTVGINPFHLHDFTDDQMVKLFVDKEWVLYEKAKHRVYGVYVFVKLSEIEKVV